MTSLRRKIIEHRKYFQRMGYDRVITPQIVQPYMKTDDLIEQFLRAFAAGTFRDGHAKDIACEIVLLLDTLAPRWYS